MAEIGKVTGITRVPRVKSKESTKDDKRKTGTEKSHAVSKKADEGEGKKSGNFVDEIV